METKESNQYGWKTSKLTGESNGAQYDEKKSAIFAFTWEDPIKVIGSLIDLYNNHIASNEKFNYPAIKLTIKPSELVPEWNHFTLEINKNE